MILFIALLFISILKSLSCRFKYISFKVDVNFGVINLSLLELKSLILFFNCNSSSSNEILFSLYSSIVSMPARYACFALSLRSFILFICSSNVLNSNSLVLLSIIFNLYVPVDIASISFFIVLSTAFSNL